MSLNVGPSFSTSYPLTYALPGDIFNDSRSAEAAAPSSVVSPTLYTPSFSLTVTLSLHSNWKGRTV